MGVLPRGALDGVAPTGHDEAVDEVADPSVITLFRSRLRDGAAAEYEPEAARMEALARAMPGFVAFTTFTSSDGERMSVVEFASEEAHTAWRDHPEHRRAQRRGREEFYDSFRIDVCRRVRRTVG